MSSRLRHLLLWVAGMGGLLFVASHFRITDFWLRLTDVGFVVALLWILLTLTSRLLMAEIAVMSVRQIGYLLTRADAFWIGWIRTFANQLVPVAGLAIYAKEIKRRADIPWSAFIALSTPMYLYGLSALGVLGTSAVAINVERLGEPAMPVLIAFIVLGVSSVLASVYAPNLIDRLPKLASKGLAEGSTKAFRSLADNHGSILGITATHALAMLGRGARVYLLFHNFGAELSLPAVLLLIVISESTVIVQITPGGLGVREGAIIGAAALLNIPADLGATVAIIDRLFMVGVTIAFSIPAFLAISRPRRQPMSR